MKRIYLDNSATSFPKAPGLGSVLSSYIEENCVNLNRTESHLSYTNFEELYALRANLCTLFGFKEPECIGFTPNITYALNWLIKGLLSPGDHVVTTSVEHNAVLRSLLQHQVSFSSIPCDKAGRSLVKEAEPLIQPNTKAFIINAASNVSGAVQNVKELCLIAKKHNLLTIVDSAQASPYIDLNMKEMGIDALAFTGHKGLLGPQGTGGFLLRKDLALTINPLVSGGTGSFSHSLEIPPVLPDRLNPGTENLVGLIGLSHSVQFVLDNLDSLKRKSRKNTALLCKGLEEICLEYGLRLVGPTSEEERSEAISISCPEPSDLSAYLLENYNIETRSGLHCSPLSHKALGTFPKGTIRFSSGVFTTEEEISICIDSVRKYFSRQI